MQGCQQVGHGPSRLRRGISVFWRSPEVSDEVEPRESPHGHDPSVGLVRAGRSAPHDATMLPLRVGALHSVLEHPRADRPPPAPAGELELGHLVESGHRAEPSILRALVKLFVRTETLFRGLTAQTEDPADGRPAVPAATAAETD